MNAEGYVRFGLDTKGERFEITGIGLTYEECNEDVCSRTYDHSFIVPLGTKKLDKILNNWMLKNKVPKIVRLRILAFVYDELQRLFNLTDKEEDLL